MFLVLMFFFAQTLSASSTLEVNYPRISNPDFSIRNNVVKVSFDYEGVAGNIRDARIYLTVSLPVNRWMDRFEVFRHVQGGWKGFFWSAEDDRRITNGRITAQVILPWYTGINQETNINGFGLAVADSRKFISNPYFIQGEIIRESWTDRILRLIKEVLLT